MTARFYQDRISTIVNFILWFSQTLRRRNSPEKKLGDKKKPNEKDKAYKEKGKRGYRRNSQYLDKHIYDRPTYFRKGMRDKTWDKAKDSHGRVRDPVTGRYMSKNAPWHMGHKPGFEFRKHQQSARERGISRKQFLDEYSNEDHFRPELPKSNMCHKGEDHTDKYLGD